MQFWGGENYNRDVLMPIDSIEYQFNAKSPFLWDLNFIKRTQLYNVWLWRKFVQQYRIDGVDDDRFPKIGNGWRGEYWGKMMRGAALVYQCSKDEVLYRILTDSVEDMLTTQKPNGAFTTYSSKRAFSGWDLWCRKYVLLGFQYYLEICKDKALADRIVSALCRHADLIMDYIGNEEGKTPINQTTHAWGGLNSSSILEPYVRLYNLTGEKKYLDFAAYIVSEGGCEGDNIFEAAYENIRAPYQYKYVKAYEMMSCFEGLIEYARVTGNEKYKQAAIRFGYKLLQTDVTIIGCCGCTHELFDHSAKMQTRDADEQVMQETCVTVTWMKLCYQLLRLTGDRVFADAIEQSFCNAYLGSLNILEIVKPAWKYAPNLEETRRFPYYSMLTFDSYNPLTADARGRAIGGVCVFFDDNTYYGCCACIGSAGIGLMGKYAVMEKENAIVMQYYIDGTVKFLSKNGKEVVLRTQTKYPYDGHICIDVVQWDDAISSLDLRIPVWCRQKRVCHNNQDVTDNGGEYVKICNVKEGSQITAVLCMDVREILPPCEDAPNRDIYAAYQYGPVLLAKDARLGDHFHAPMNAVKNDVGAVEFRMAPQSYDEIRNARLYITVANREGGETRLIDYSSAGKTLDEQSKCAVWLLK